METTEKLARFIVETSYGEIPAKAITVAKEAMLDCLGVLLAGSRDPASKIMVSFLKSLGGEPQSGVIGWGLKTSVLNAALANGTMAHVLDYDDVSVGGHPTATILPVLLALGEKMNASGKEVIEAYILGFEVFARCCEAVGLGPRKLGFHPTPTMGVMGAAAVAAKLLKLDVEQTRMALGLAASNACGMGENRGSMTKPFHAGNAARGGLIAAMLVSEGYTAAPNILEIPFGYIYAFSAAEGYNTNKMTTNLGSPFKVISPGITIKKYPTCGETHQAIDAMLYLMKNHDISSAEVASVEVDVNPMAMGILAYSEPGNILQSKFSMNFVMAIALQERKVGLEQLADEKINNPKTRELMKKVKMIGRKRETEAAGRVVSSTVRVRLKNGKEYSHEVLNRLGTPANPLSKEELRAKYTECARLGLTKKAIERSLNLIENLEELKDIGELVETIE